MEIEPGSEGRSEEWVLSHQDGVTKLILTHSLPDPGVEDWEKYFGGLYRGWTLFVATLEQLSRVCRKPSSYDNADPAPSHPDRLRR